MASQHSGTYCFMLINQMLSKQALKQAQIVIDNDSYQLLTRFFTGISAKVAEFNQNANFLVGSYSL